MITGVVTMAGHEYSERSSRKVRVRWKSLTGWDAEVINAVTPKTLKRYEYLHPVTWLDGWSTSDNSTSRKSKRACAMSHLLAWHYCAEKDVPLVLLEHDAWMVNNPKEAIEEFLESPYEVFNLNLLCQPTVPGEGILPTTSLAGRSAVFKPSYARYLYDLAMSEGFYTNDKFTNLKYHPTLKTDGICYHQEGFCDKHVPGINNLTTSSTWSRGQ